MDNRSFNSAYRAGIGIAILYVLWLLVPAVRNYATLVVGNARHSSQTDSTRPRLSAANLESALLRANQFKPDSQLHCESGSKEWDYVCSFSPTPMQPRARMQFGVNVDAMRWLQVSPVLPVGTNLPPPGKRVTDSPL
jgi:hypothetical protein